MDVTTISNVRQALVEPYYEMLDAASFHLFEDGSGRLRMTIDGDRSYIDVKVVSAFPISDPGTWIGFLTAKDKVIGVVEDPRLLDDESRDFVRDALKLRYFIPAISAIHQMTEEFGAVYCRVETDSGKREFVVRGIRDSLEDLGDGRILLTDVDGNRYRIPDWRVLDRRSRRWLERLL